MYRGSDGKAHGTARCFTARSLQDGTTGWHCHSVSLKSTQLLKEQGHRGISVSHYCFDRAKFSILFGLASARHKLWEDEHRKGTTGLGPLAAKCDWYVGTGCAMHDGSKAIEWATRTHLPSDEIMKDLHIVIASCRNGYDQIVKVLPEFLMQHMERVEKNTIATRSRSGGGSWV